jgi:hypothetical protein
MCKITKQGSRVAQTLVSLRLSPCYGLRFSLTRFSYPGHYLAGRCIARSKIRRGRKNNSLVSVLGVPAKCGHPAWGACE